MPKLIPYAGFDPYERRPAHPPQRKVFVDFVMARFDAGRDSDEIARELVVRECAVAVALAEGRDNRWGA